MSEEEQKSGYFFLTVFAVVLIGIVVCVVVYLKSVHDF
jgi:hypothetical protein